MQPLLPKLAFSLVSIGMALAAPAASRADPIDVELATLGESPSDGVCRLGSLGNDSAALEYCLTVRSLRHHHHILAARKRNLYVIHPVVRLEAPIEIASRLELSDLRGTARIDCAGRDHLNLLCPGVLLTGIYY